MKKFLCLIGWHDWSTDLLHDSMWSWRWTCKRCGKEKYEGLLL